MAYKHTNIQLVHKPKKSNTEAPLTWMPLHRKILLAKRESTLVHQDLNP